MLEFQQQISELGILSLRNDFPLRLRVVSGSMTPMLRLGDDLIVSACNLDTLTCGDLVVFRVKKDFLTHRVIEVYPDSVRTKGDAWHVSDPLVSKNDIIGIVHMRETNQQLYDFSLPRWYKLNRLLGYLNRLQVRWIDWINAMIAADKDLEQNKTRRSTWLSYPFRAVERIAIFIWGYR